MRHNREQRGFALVAALMANLILLALPLTVVLTAVPVLILRKRR